MTVGKWFHAFRLSRRRQFRRNHRSLQLAGTTVAVWTVEAEAVGERDWAFGASWL
jgi:hypothetical protein